MIHTVTVNPALDITYRVPAVKIDDTIRASEVLRAAGGKGINVSRVAARLSHPTVAMGFIGGRAGDEVDELLSSEGIRTWFTRCLSPTRTNVIIQDEDGKQIRVSGPGGSVTEGEVENLKSNIFELRTPEFLVLSGSLLAGMPKDFYVQVMHEAREQGVKVAVDADGDELKRTVSEGIYLIKPNKFELERFVGFEVKDFSDVMRGAKKALEAGVTAVLVSLGADGAVLVTENAAWKAVPPDVQVDSAVGAGDSMLAGALIARAEGSDWREALRMGVACGTATAVTPGTELCHPRTVRWVFGKVSLEPVYV